MERPSFIPILSSAPYLSLGHSLGMSLMDSSSFMHTYCIVYTSHTISHPLEKSHISGVKVGLHTAWMHDTRAACMSTSLNTIKL